MAISLCIPNIDLAAVLCNMNIADFSRRTLLDHCNVIWQMYEDPDSVDSYMIFILELLTTHQYFSYALNTSVLLFSVF